jgi:ABC-type phosphate/phosphonate transport system substrate-binding protein
MVFSLVTAIAPSESQAGGEVGFVVLKEHGVGSSAQAQPFLDRFVALAAKKAGWAGAKGKYLTDRKAAEELVDREKPQFGILSLPAYLTMKAPRKLETLGQVTVSRAGQQEYHLVSKSASDLAGCKGAILATDHADDPRFVERVVAAGAFKLADFKLELTKRPLEGLKKVVKDQAKCALIDDAQLAEMASLEGGKELKSVWKSAKLPPMVIVAFPSATAAEKSALKSQLAGLCEGDGKAACGEIGIASLKPVGDEAYAQVLAAYGKDK